MKILITGGASGLGMAITKALAKDINNHVYITYSKSSLNAKALEAEFSNVKSIQCDFRDLKSQDLLQSQIPDLDLDILINNAYAGTFLKKHFHKTLSEDFLKDFEENLIPTIKITQSAILGFRKKKNGKIITILTSALINVPPIGSAIYTANKAYLKQLVKVWANENIRFNISSNSISPSFMQTQINASLDERLVEQMVKGHPLKKLLTIDEVAETVLFLTKASTHLNGVDVELNAGASLK
jgi:NAD(P)-dependent dehydrogenase (short-subunit alcohol dehydrogenase family)